MKNWKYLEDLTEKIFHPINGTPMDELFTRYMYFERAKQGIKRLFVLNYAPNGMWTHFTSVYFVKLIL